MNAMAPDDACRTLARSLFAQVGPWGAHCTLIGGFVPAYLVPEPPIGLAPHVGTRDVDLALHVAVDGNAECYRTLKNNLMAAGLRQSSEKSYAWIRDIEGQRYVVELFAPVDEPELGGGIQRKPIARGGSGLTALGLFGLELLERDCEFVMDEGPLFDNKGVKAVRICVCGPALWLCLKAWALKERTKSKDGYDVVWMVRALGLSYLAERFRTRQLGQCPFGASAIDNLAECFATYQHTGPLGWCVEAGFVGDDAVREARDASAMVLELIRMLRLP